MLNYIYVKYLNREQKNRVKKFYYKANKIITDSFFRYDQSKLVNAILDMGIKRGDTLLLHSSFNYFNGFKGDPRDIIKCFIQILGKDGNLIMVSMPYRSSACEYLKKNPVFNVRKTPSKMGIVSEVFRRKKGVLRSLHPTHPVLAYGKDAAWITEGHEKCICPCGAGTPFEKLKTLDGKIFHFDVAFRKGFTFIHYLEDIIKEKLPFPLYREKPMPAKIIDYQGKELEMETYVFSDTAVQTRNLDTLRKYFLRNGVLKYARIGKTKLMHVSAENAVFCTQKMIANNIHFFTRNM